MRVWDIIDQIQPNFEVTRHNERPVRFEGPVTKFKLTVAALALATATVFYVNIPSNVAVISASTGQSATFQSPPLDRLFESNREQFSKESEKDLLSRLDNVSVGDWSPTEDDLLRAVAANLEEQRPSVSGERSNEDVKGMLRGGRRKLA